MVSHEKNFGQWLSHPPKGDEIVISGVSGKLPESDNIYEFRDKIFAKEELVTDDARRGVFNNPEVPQRGARVKTINKFDAGFFGVHQRQADNMDPMMRILLETAVEAIMDAGIHPSELIGSATGVFIGACWSDMEVENIFNNTENQTFIYTGYQRSLLAQRISYFLKLKGPAIVVDSACSSSMNALEHAFKAIRTGQCENAIVGSTTIILHPGTTMQFFRLGVLSPEASCKVFDEGANGYVRGEGVTSLLLQKNKFARRAYAEVVHTKINCDGFKIEGITFPSTESQSKLMADVLDESGTNPDELSYMEAHGTGTKVGDPQEVEAIDATIAQKRHKPLWIGSIKCNVGHSEPSSGTTAVIKVLLAMENGFIPPNINLKKIKEGLKGFGEGRLKLVLEKVPLQDEQALVAVNNFGFGGNNCQLLLRRWRVKKMEIDDDFPRIICASGRTPEAVNEILNDVYKKNDVEFTALIHRLFSKTFLNHIYRGYCVVYKKKLIKKEVAPYSGTPKDVYISFGNLSSFGKIIGKYLLRFEPFKSSMLRVNSILLPKGFNVIAEIMADRSNTAFNGLIGFLVQIGIVDLFKSITLVSKAIYGRGWSTIICQYMDEVLDLEEAVQTVLNNTKKIFKAATSEPNHKKYIYPLNDWNENSILIDISDVQNGGMNIYCPKTNEFKFLEILGSLYKHGHDIQIHNLYPQVKFPVSRGTPMISPLIKWNHKEDRKTYVYGQKTLKYLQKEFYILLKENFQYLEGHVIDGRNLIPATCYLYLLWDILRKGSSEKGIVFENCKFWKAVTLPPKSYVRLLVNIGKGDGRFQVSEKNDVIVTGRVFLTNDIKQHQLNIPQPFEENTPEKTLDESEVYRELSLRGYDYKGAFKGLKKYNIESSTGLIKWEDNWISFLDAMLQVKILELDTRLLYVPVEIAKLSIDFSQHTKVVQNLGSESLVPVISLQQYNVVKAGGIEVKGIQARSILRKRDKFEPVLEKNVFVPNETTLTLEDSVRVNTQIILENCLEHQIKAIEFIDDYNDTRFILPEVKKALGDIPLVSHDFVISSKNHVEVDDIRVDNVLITSTSNFQLIIGCKLLQKPSILTKAFSGLNEKGFILSREEISFVPPQSTVTIHIVGNEKLVLISHPKCKTNTTCVKITPSFSWLPQLKALLREEDEVIAYAQGEPLSGILGLVNCIRREPGGDKLRCFFMMDEAPNFDPQNEFYKPQIEKDLAINVYKTGSWGTYRHLLLKPLEEVSSEHCYVNVVNRGDLSSLRWIEGPLKLSSNLPENRILISNSYVALNFRDVMTASGRIGPDVATRHRIKQQCVQGLEFSGRDLTGRRILGMVPAKATASLIDASKTYIWPVPDNWTLEEAASVPVVYGTVIYALLMRTSLHPGKSILIHAALGGIGIAALNVAIYHKCEIFVTVGTPEKKEFLRKNYPQIKETHIGNSRDCSFEEMIKKNTQGRGVDIVLNSLSEEKMQASLRCLAKGGQFFEIGKFDLSKNTSLEMMLLQKGGSFHGIMLDELFNDEKDRFGMSQAIEKGIAIGYVKPLPITIFEKNEIVDAIRFMAAGKHIGKVLIRVRDEETEGSFLSKQTFFKAIPSFYCDNEKSYIIVGGLGGFGLELADWLVLRGAKKLVLVSRNGVKNGYQSYRIRMWKSYGVIVKISTADVTKKKGCLELLRDANNEGSVDAIFNLAVVIKDALFENQTEENFDLSLHPKAIATELLDEVSRGLCPTLRSFVVFSSVSCGRGNAGQSNYGMANSVMERVCENRRDDGLPALAIQWGAVGEVGLVAQLQKDGKQLEISGTLQQKISSCLDTLDDALRRTSETIVSSMVVAEKRVAAYGSAVEAVAAILGIKDVQSVNPTTTLPELGMDSMTGTEIAQMLERDYGIILATKDMRELNFGRLFELELEKKSNVNEISKVKTEESINFFLKFKPNSEEKPIVRLPSALDEGADGPSVFFLPGAEGAVFVFESVAKRLKAHAYALQYKIKECPKTIEEIAKSLIPSIKDRLTDKRFNIVSYSFGTVVTVALVRLLEKEGFKGNVLAIDGSPKYIAKIFLQHVPLADQITMETSFICIILSQLVSLEVIVSKREQLMSFTNIKDRLDFASTLVAHDAEQIEKDALEAMYKRLWAAVSYKWQEGKIASFWRLCKCSQPVTLDIEGDYGYSKICTKLEVETMEGNHATILENEQLHERINEMF